MSQMTTTLSQTKRWSETQLLSLVPRSDLDLRSLETQFLSSLRHSSWPADRFGTQLLARARSYAQFDFELADLASTSSTVDRISNLRSDDLSVIGRMHDVV